MPVRFAINGLGRIGRALARIAGERPRLELVAVNDLQEAGVLAHLLQYDSVHGRGPVAGAGPGELRIGERRVACFQEAEPAAVPWSKAGVEVVVECTGRFKDRALIEPHLRSGVRHVVVSANAEGVDLTICLGVNDRELDPARHRLISNASCSTNCVAVTALVLDRRFGIHRALLSTVHSYTRDQQLLDSVHCDRRRARAAALNMIPTTTGAARALGRVLPHLADRLHGQSIRVPVPDVSLIDLVVELQRPGSPEELRSAFRTAAAGELQGILAVTDEELVSSDFLGNPHSATIDLPLLQHVDERFYRVVSWYDNEWGYAHRLADLLERLEESR